VIVVDASALMAVIKGESGWGTAAEQSAGGVMSAANLTEAVTRTWEIGLADSDVMDVLDALDISVRAVDVEIAIVAGSLWPLRRKNFSLGDRLCIATAQVLNLAVLTGERRWSDHALPVKIETFR
jgi:ribonuclease VapC